MPIHSKLSPFSISCVCVILCYATSAGAQWQQNTALPGGAISTFTTDGSYLYAATDTGGVFRSADNGTHWESVNTGLPDKSIASVATNGTMLFAAMKNGFSGAIFLSSDHGSTWVAPASPYFGFVFCLAPKGSNMLAGTWFGVVQSTDGGATWPTLSTTGLPSNAGVNALAANGSTIFASVATSSVGGTGTFRSTNGGSSWTNKSVGLPSNISAALLMMGSTVFAGTELGVYKSTNNGNNWAPAHTGIEPAKVNSLVSIGSTLFVGTAIGVYSSSTNGETWINITDNLPANTPVTAIAMSGNQIMIASGEDSWKRPLAEVGSVKVKNVSNDPVAIWPNPCQRILNIENSKRIANIIITDLTGRIVYKEITRANKTTSVDLRELPAGIFLLHTQMADGHLSTEKLVVE